MFIDRILAISGILIYKCMFYLELTAAESPIYCIPSHRVLYEALFSAQCALAEGVERALRSE